jgi:hypothetical protein
MGALEAGPGDRTGSRQRLRAERARGPSGRGWVLAASPGGPEREQRGIDPGELAGAEEEAAAAAGRVGRRPRRLREEQNLLL